MSVTVVREVNQVIPEESNITNSIPINMGLMKGDILVYRGEGDVVRLPVGTNGQVLTADSTAECGISWKNPT